METITGGSLLLQFIVIVALTGINAFFSSAEMAIVSINKNKLKILVEEGNKKAIMLENLMNNSGWNNTCRIFCFGFCCNRAFTVSVNISEKIGNSL